MACSASLGAVGMESALFGLLNVFGLRPGIRWRKKRVVPAHRFWCRATKF